MDDVEKLPPSFLVGLVDITRLMDDVAITHFQGGNRVWTCVMG
jgi:hypothetical protein